MTLRTSLLNTLCLSSTLLLASPALAGGEIFDPTIDTCTSLNCGATVIDGTILFSAANAAQWTTSVYAGAGECLRIAVTSQYTDLIATLSGPGGTLNRDDDGGGFLRPLIKLDPAPHNGWYTFSLSTFGAVPSTGNFEVRYGRYNHLNPNCATPTPPLGPALSRRK